MGFCNTTIQNLVLDPIVLSDLHSVTFTKLNLAIHTYKINNVYLAAFLRIIKELKVSPAKTGLNTRKILL